MQTLPSFRVTLWVIFLYAVTGLTLAGCTAAADEPEIRPRTLIIFFDGLRTDYITPERMPRLYQLSREGVIGTAHHSVFPTMTRVNATAYATGAYPGKNGIMGNELYFREIDSAHSINTAMKENLEKMVAATDSNIVTAMSMGELVQQMGSRMMVFSDGSQGQAYFQNHKLCGGAILNTETIWPEGFEEEVEAVLGPRPAYEDLNRPRHKWITDGYLHYGLAEDGPLVSAIWYADPDETAHARGVGAPMVLEALKVVDGELGRILDTLQRRDLLDKVNIIITSDHGFISRAGTDANWPEPLLISKGIKKGKDSDDVVFADGAIYVKNQDRTKTEEIVKLLQETDWIGGIFTKPEQPGAENGWVPGTLSFDLVHWNHHERAADILVTDYWDDKTNVFGFQGTSYYGGGPGSHGGFSPYEVNISLIVHGPSFKKGLQSELPTSNVDILPTILQIYETPLPATVQGRVMHELLHNGKEEALKPVKRTIEASAGFGWGVYKQELAVTELGNYLYTDFSRAIRER